MKVRINYLAIIIGFIAIVVLSYFQFWFYKEGQWLEFRGTSWLGYAERIYVLIQSIIPGVITGYVAKNNGMLHASVAVILGALATAIYFSEFAGSYLNAIFQYIVQIGIFNIISGLLGETLYRKHVSL